jgi:hypothetical protein
MTASIVASLSTCIGGTHRSSAGQTLATMNVRSPEPANLT